MGMITGLIVAVSLLLFVTKAPNKTTNQVYFCPYLSTELTDFLLMTKSLLNTRINQICFGTPTECLRIECMPISKLDTDKVRVKIDATNINPSDLLSIQGVGQYRHSHTPPRVPGFEAVGYVIETNSPHFSKGDRVLVAASGTWQTLVDVSPENLFHLPQNLENGYACQLYINALTAWVITTGIVHLSKRDVVIINAGTSAIGKIFAQLSATIGFTLIAVTTRPRNYPIGSAYVIDAKDDLTTQIQQLGLPQPNVAFDAIGGKTGYELLNTLSKHATFINYGTLSFEFYEPRFFEHAKNSNIQFSTFFLRYWENQVGKDVRRATFYAMLEHFITNKIRLDIDRIMPLDQVVEAIELIESKEVVLHGKIILMP